MTDSPSVSILMYHQVGDFARMREHRANYCDHGRFARQMHLIGRLGYRVLDLDTALACLLGLRPMPQRALVLTFDDAYDGFYDYALPVLQSHGFPATVYAISGWIGRRAEWFAKDPGRPIPSLMSAARLREIHAAGMTVGSHTANHVKLGEASRAIQSARARRQQGRPGGPARGGGPAPVLSLRQLRPQHHRDRGPGRLCQCDHLPAGPRHARGPSPRTAAQGDLVRRQPARILVEARREERAQARPDGMA